MPHRVTRLLLHAVLAAVPTLAAAAELKLPAPRARARASYAAAIDALAARSKQRPDSALAALRELRDAHPSDVALHISYMQIAAAANHFADLVPDYKARYESDKKSAPAPFLYSLIAPDSLRPALIEEALRRDKKFAPALLSRGSTSLQKSPPDTASALEDLALAVRIDPGFMEAWTWLGYVLSARGDTANALASFRGAAISDAGWRSNGLVGAARRLVEVGAPLSAVALLEHLPETRSDWIDYNSAPLYVAAGQAPRALALIDGLLAHAADAGHRAWYDYCRATLFAQMGRADSAFAWLDRAVADGFYDGNRLAGDPTWGAYWAPLAGRPEYAAAVNKIAAAGVAARRASSGERKQAILSTRIDLELPAITLRDAQSGAEVPLSSFRGKVVVLDFWATWCGPCRRTMPLLSEFTMGTKRDSVVVLSAQIFERTPDAGERAKKLFRENKYAMRLMGADNELGDLLGFNSIPTMYVIGPDGRIAYKNVGYTPSLVEELEWQTGSLWPAPGEKGAARP